MKNAVHSPGKVDTGEDFSSLRVGKAARMRIYLIDENGLYFKYKLTFENAARLDIRTSKAGAVRHPLNVSGRFSIRLL